MKLLVATGNEGKLRELVQLLAPLDLDVMGLDQLDNPPVVAEDGATFADNARKKALTLARFSGCLTLADDSGLCVDVMDGAPGVFSARYAGEQGDDKANNARLVRELGDIPLNQRKAHFHCCIALAWPDGRCETVEGRVDGLIIDQQRGSHGFGYDPLFLVPEYGKTMAELPADIKNRISHRGRALQKIVPLLKTIVQD
ncbi:XTP/dITP diphosphatase [Pelobacter sp. M08fum]|uniref:dITP/XTP pyrophosphatase n=2 Tax=Pelovirga terrestris TaxID=2771352 RepID=A0A8J6UNB3_9BACT|nr:XTP/dITP diphosphatase [Pelovirga terrestris]